MAHIVDERGYNQVFKSSPAQTIRLRRRVEAIVREMGLPDNGEERQHIHILEIGSGTGDMSFQLAQLTGARVTGVDLSPRFIELARNTHRHPNLNFELVDLSKESPGSDADRYDYIVGNGILHHLYHHLDSFFPALIRWLVPGGRLIFWEPNLWNPYVFLIFSVPTLRRLAKLEPEEMAFTADFARKKLLKAGFAPVRVNPRDFLLPTIPSSLIAPVITVGGWLEHVPGLRRLAQSVFIVAKRPVLPAAPSIRARAP
jgi:2-polyprenyl-3-methyl-5-hydroxy-6-metoxy-1,4-benzoquinol methylase